MLAIADKHRIKVGKAFEPAPAGMLPMCVAGASATRPDDCGGIYGYHDFVAAVSDPSHPEHADMSEWIGRPTRKHVSPKVRALIDFLAQAFSRPRWPA